MVDKQWWPSGVQIMVDLWWTNSGDKIVLA